MLNLTEAQEVATTEIPDSLPVNTTTDWQAAFGFGQTQTSNTASSKDWQDDDLGTSQSVLTQSLKMPQ